MNILAWKDCLIGINIVLFGLLLYAFCGLLGKKELSYTFDGIKNIIVEISLFCDLCKNG